MGSKLQPLERLADLQHSQGQVVWVAPVVATGSQGQVLVWDAALSLRTVVDAALAADARVLVLPAVEGSRVDRGQWVEAAREVVLCVPWCGTARER